MTITPDQARELLNGATPGPWREDGSNIMNHDGDPLLSDGSFGDPNWYNDRDITLISAAPDLAQTIAGMRWQTGVHAGDEDIWAETPEEEALAVMAGKRPEVRLIRRLVGPVEEA